MVLLAKRAMVPFLQPEDGDVDLDAMQKDAENDLQGQLCDLRDRAGTDYFVKKEAELRNVGAKAKAARRRCHKRHKPSQEEGGLHREECAQPSAR